MNSHLDITRAGELTNGQLHKVERSTNEDEDHQVWDKESTSTILISSVGEPPDIAQSNLETIIRWNTLVHKINEGQESFQLFHVEMKWSWEE